MNQKLQKFISHETLQDLIGKLFVVLAIVYLLLFCGESILPGMVMEVFNINILLLFLIGSVGYFAWLDKKGLKNFELKKIGKILALAILIILATTILATLFIVQYKIGIIESIFHIVLAFLIVRLFYEMIN